MENGAFHEDGSSGGQRQTSPPWKFATTDDFINVTAKVEKRAAAGELLTVRSSKPLTYFSFFQSFSILKMSSLSRLT